MITTEFLMRFSANQDDPRKFLHAPFSHGEWIYATDGHLAVRVPKTESITAAVNGDTPKNIADLFERHKIDTFIDSKEFQNLPPPDKCPDCNGSGVSYTCPDCDGCGEFDHGRHSYDCKGCQATGQVDDGEEEEACSTCRGNGVLQFQPFKIVNWNYNLRYLHKIAELPGMRFAQRPEGPDGYGDAAAYFVFDGGEGLLMPVMMVE